MYEHFYSPNILAIASSRVGEDSLSVRLLFFVFIYSPRPIRVANGGRGTIIGRFGTNFFLRFLRTSRPTNISLNIFSSFIFDPFLFSSFLGAATTCHASFHSPQAKISMVAIVSSYAKIKSLWGEARNSNNFSFKGLIRCSIVKVLRHCT